MRLCARVGALLRGAWGHRAPGSLSRCHGDLWLRARPERLCLTCPLCGYVSTGWVLDARPPAARFTGPLSFRELAQARKHGTAPVVLPEWETRRQGRARQGRAKEHLA